MAAANGETCNHRYYRFRTGTNLALEVQYVQVMHTGIITVSAVVTTNFLIAACAERFVASTGQNNYADVVIIAGIRQRTDHLFHGDRTEGIAYLRTINGDFAIPSVDFS